MKNSILISLIILSFLAGMPAYGQQDSTSVADDSIYKSGNDIPDSEIVAMLIDLTEVETAEKLSKEHSQILKLLYGEEYFLASAYSFQKFMESKKRGEVTRIQWDPAFWLQKNDESFAEHLNYRFLYCAWIQDRIDAVPYLPGSDGYAFADKMWEFIGCKDAIEKVDENNPGLMEKLKILKKKNENRQAEKEKEEQKKLEDLKKWIKKNNK